MKRFRIILIIFLVSLTGAIGNELPAQTVSPAKATLLIDSLESILHEVPNNRKAELYDTLAALAEVLSKERSLDYYLKLYQLPDSLVSYRQKIKATRKIAGIYLNMDQIDKANLYIDAYAGELKKYPQRTGDELIKAVSEKNAQAIKRHFKLTKNEVLVILLLLIIVAILYLSYLYRRFKSVKNKKMLLQREAEIIRLKNQELESELEKTIQSKTSLEEEKIVKLRKTHLKLKKELKKLEDSIYNRNAFLNGLGPELRTALSSILGFSEELRAEVEKLENEDLKANSIDLFAKNLQLDIILENMVDMSGAQINLLNLDIQSHPVLLIVDKVSESLRYLTENDKGKLEVKIPNTIPNIKADADKLIRILSDVIINVYKQSTKDNVTISASTNQSLSEVSIVVSNASSQLSRTGLEKPVKEIQDNGSGKEAGSLHLYTELFASRELVAAMGGTVQISLIPGEGATVAVTLPAAESTSKKQEQDTIKSTQKEALSTLVRDVDIFLVEDDRMNRMVIETMLKDAGKVTTAVDGEETLQIIEKYHNEGKVFDIMLFDINLPPPWDGIALMHRIKRDYPEFRKVPFVAQTAYAMASDRERFLNEGFDDYLTKPINKGELLTIMHHQLELFREQNKNNS